MGLDIRIVREQVISDGQSWGGLGSDGNPVKIIVQEELGSWHRFYALSEWAEKNNSWENGIGPSAFRLPFIVEDLDRLRNLLAKVIKDKDPSLFLEIDGGPMDKNNDYYWECVKELKELLDKEIPVERARHKANQYSEYYIEADW